MAGSGKTMLVAGGSGFIGSYVCREGIREGFRVVSLSRRGRPAHLKEKWADQVEWQQADIGQRHKEWVDVLRPADVVVSCVGKWGWGRSPDIHDANGEVNIRLAQLAKRECPQLAKYVYVSTTPWSSRLQHPFSAYFGGKVQAENMIQSLFPHNYLIMRPTWVFGWKHYWGGLWFPWHYVGRLIEHVMHPIGHYTPHSKVMVPPNCVEELAHAIALGCTVGRDVQGVFPAGRVRELLEREAQNLPLDDWLRPELTDHIHAYNQYHAEVNYVEKFGLTEIHRKHWEQHIKKQRYKQGAMHGNALWSRPDWAHPRNTEHFSDHWLTPSYRLERNERKLLLANEQRKKSLMFEKRRAQEVLAGEKRLLGEEPGDDLLVLGQKNGDQLISPQREPLTLVSAANGPMVRGAADPMSGGATAWGKPLNKITEEEWQAHLQQSTPEYATPRLTRSGTGWSGGGQLL